MSVGEFVTIARGPFKGAHGQVTKEIKPLPTHQHVYAVRLRTGGEYVFCRDELEKISFA